MISKKCNIEDSKSFLMTIFLVMLFANLSFLNICHVIATEVPNNRNYINLLISCELKVKENNRDVDTMIMTLVRMDKNFKFDTLAGTHFHMGSKGALYTYINPLKERANALKKQIVDITPRDGGVLFKYLKTSELLNTSVWSPKDWAHLAKFIKEHNTEWLTETRPYSLSFNVDLDKDQLKPGRGLFKRKYGNGELSAAEINYLIDISPNLRNLIKKQLSKIETAVAKDSEQDAEQPTSSSEDTNNKKSEKKMTSRNYYSSPRFFNNQYAFGHNSPERSQYYIRMLYDMNNTQNAVFNEFQGTMRSITNDLAHIRSKVDREIPKSIENSKSRVSLDPDQLRQLTSDTISKLTYEIDQTIAVQKTYSISIVVAIIFIIIFFWLYIRYRTFTQITDFIEKKNDEQNLISADFRDTIIRYVNEYTKHSNDSINQNLYTILDFLNISQDHNYPKTISGVIGEPINRFLNQIDKKDDSSLKKIVDELQEIKKDIFSIHDEKAKTLSSIEKVGHATQNIEEMNKKHQNEVIDALNKYLKSNYLSNNLAKISNHLTSKIKNINKEIEARFTFIETALTEILERFPGECQIPESEFSDDFKKQIFQIFQPLLLAAQVRQNQENQRIAEGLPKQFTDIGIAVDELIKLCPTFNDQEQKDVIDIDLLKKSNDNYHFLTELKSVIERWKSIKSRIYYNSSALSFYLEQFDNSFDRMVHDISLIEEENTQDKVITFVQTNLIQAMDTELEKSTHAENTVGDNELEKLVIDIFQIMTERKSEIKEYFRTIGGTESKSGSDIDDIISRIFKYCGIRKIQPVTPGMDFDPNLHYSKFSENAEKDNIPSGKVVRTEAPGYMIRWSKNVLKKALVVRSS